MDVAKAVLSRFVGASVSRDVHAVKRLLELAEARRLVEGFSNGVSDEENVAACREHFENAHDDGVSNGSDSRVSTLGV